MSHFRFPYPLRALVLPLGLAIAAALPIAGTTTVQAAEPAARNSKRDHIEVIVDRARVVRIAKPADTVIVGNPSIVDATIQDARTLVLTGRLFGVTNIIVLDADGDPVVDETVVVKGHETNMVHIYRQSIRETLACAPKCENTLTLGDSLRIDEKNTRFSLIQAQIAARNALAEGVSGQ